MLAAHLFVTCLIDSLFPEIGESVVRVLRRAGVDVRFAAEPVCCGQPAFNAGFRHEAMAMARRAVAAFEALPGDIVIPSGSCTAMIRHRYPELLADDPDWLERSRGVSARVWEFSQYLVDRLGYHPPPQASPPNRLAYHASCHLLRELGIDRQPRMLLDGLGKDTLPLEPDCCGFGGVFAVDQVEISEAMLDHRLAQIRDSGAGVVVAADVGCLMHIEGALRRAGSSIRCRHIAQVLDGQV
jgi:L-lactate dehydrogenase complex protein LldE